MFVNIFGMYFFWLFKVLSGGYIRFEVDNSGKVFVEFWLVFIDVGFGGFLEGRYFKVRILLLNVVFNGILCFDGLGYFVGFGIGVGSLYLLMGGSFGGCGGGNIL